MKTIETTVYHPDTGLPIRATVHYEVNRLGTRADVLRLGTDRGQAGA